jgi:phosphate-selective porin
MDRLFSDSSLPQSRTNSNLKFGRLKSREELEKSTQQEEGHVVEREQLLKLSFGSISRSRTPLGTTTKPSTSVLGRIFESKLDQAADPDLRRKLITDEILNLRVALYQLKQQKELSAADEEMVEVFTAKLRALNDL